jgi:multidrug resistance efflux pump
LLSAQADVDAKRHEMLMRQDAAQTPCADKRHDIRRGFAANGSAANVAAANYHGALAALELAELNLSHATVRAPVAGYVTHLGFAPVTTQLPAKRKSPSSMRTASGWWVF